MSLFLAKQPYYTYAIPQFQLSFLSPFSKLGESFCFQIFSPINLLLSVFQLGNFPVFLIFSPSCLLPISFRLGSFSRSSTFSPTRLLPISFRLGNFSRFDTFSPTNLLPSTFPLVKILYRENFPKFTHILSSELCIISCARP